MRDLGAGYAGNRASNWLTVPAFHSPTPRGVLTPRSLRPAAMARRLVAPAACSSGMSGLSARLNRLTATACCAV